MDPLTKRLLAALGRWFAQRGEAPTGLQLKTATGHALRLLSVGTIAMVAAIACVAPMALASDPSSTVINVGAIALLAVLSWAGVRIVQYFNADRTGLFIEPTELVVHGRHGTQRFARGSAVLELRRRGPFAWVVVADATGRSAAVRELFIASGSRERLLIRRAQRGAGGWRVTDTRWDGDPKQLQALVADAERLEATAPATASAIGF